MKYLPLYKKWAKKRSITEVAESPCSGGLCSTILYKSPLFFLFNYGHPYGEYWAYDGDIYEDSGWDIQFKFTPTRQNIVLLMAAMNNEL